MKVLMALVLGLILAGCAAGNGNGAGSTTTQEETTVYEETTVLAGAEDYPRPPVSTLSYGGREVRGGLGTYCWYSGDLGTCADAAFAAIPGKQEALRVPSGSEMVFRFGGQSSAYKVEAGAYPMNKISKGLSGNPAVLESSFRSLKTHGSGIKRTIPAEVPPGDYAVVVGLSTGQNGAEYGFRVMVE